MGIADRISDRMTMNAVVRARLRKSGIKAHARVIRAEGWTGHHDSGRQTFNVRELVLEVHPPEGVPYKVTYSGGVAARIAGGHATQGSDVPVRIDPSNPERVVVDVDRAKGRFDAAMDKL